MRLLATLLLLASGVALAGCGNSCQDLGERLCQCSGAGSSRDTCKSEVKNQLSAAGSNDEAACTTALHNCAAPLDATFCEWVGTACGKASCGLSNESPADPLVCVPPPPTGP